MKLRSAHIALIATAIFMVVVVVAFGIHRYVTTDEVSGLILGGSGAVTGVGLALYLRYFLRKSRRS